jgi:hypothetical protein
VSNAVEAGLERCTDVSMRHLEELSTDFKSAMRCARMFETIDADRR